jgi:hypothetical protein
MSGKISTLQTRAHHPGSEKAEHTRRRPPAHAAPRPIVRAGLIAAGLVAGIAAGELAARWLGFEFRLHMRNRVYFAEPDPLLGWRNRPGVSGPYGGEEFFTRVSLNEVGLRGRQYPIARRPETLRIAVLGDSQAWGDGVADGETFSDLLDGQDHGRVEVLNFAAPGYGTDQQLLGFDNRAAAYAPDVVVTAVFVGNDIQDNLSAGTFQYPKPYFTVDESGALTVHGIPVHSSRIVHFGIEVYRAAMHYSAILNAIGEVTAAPPPVFVPTAELPPEPTIYRPLYERDLPEEERAGLELTARLLQEIARHARAIGGRPVVLILPELWQVDVANNAGWRRRLRERGADWRRPQRFLRRALESDSVEVIDALPALARASRGAETQEEHTYYRAWRHLTAQGHRTVARLLAGRLPIAGTPVRRERAPRNDHPDASAVAQREQHGLAR